MAIDFNYPRPTHRRENYTLLDGRWDFRFDQKDEGKSKGYQKGFIKQHDIIVPFVYQSQASGIGVEDPIDVVWYQTKISLEKSDFDANIVINFEGVDYEAEVWLNGQRLGGHYGAYTRFSFIINEAAKVGENLLVVRVKDSFDISQPRGKQRWQPNSYGCWYTPSSGIWKSVWIEKIKSTHLSFTKITPRLDNLTIEVDYAIDNFVSGLRLECQLSYKGLKLKTVIEDVLFSSGRVVIPINSPLFDYQHVFWHPVDPKMYDIKFRLLHEDTIFDVVESYFGFREMVVKQSNVLLNGFSYYQKLVLYQGYWEKTNISLPSIEEAKKDLELIKELGFNGIRIHQVITDERFLALCDALGIIVWCEFPSPHIFNHIARTNTLLEWKQIMEQNYNHPSICTWVIYNESWGIRDVCQNKETQQFVKALFELSKSIDGYRPIISNDGWEHVDSDIITIHHYEQNAVKLHNLYENTEDVLNGKKTQTSMRQLLADDVTYQGQPLIFSEFGGAALKKDTDNGWGYGESVDGAESFYERFASFINTMHTLPQLCGYCYTQFSDVEHEKNGFVTIGRDLKVDKNRIRKIIDSCGKERL